MNTKEMLKRMSLPTETVDAQLQEVFGNAEAESASLVGTFEPDTILKGRVISVHLKDKATFGNAPVVVAGKGVVDVAACLEELKAQNFNGHISIEHEADWKDSVPQVKANIDFVKAHAK